MVHFWCAANYSLGATPTTKEAQAIADELYADFVSEEVDKVEMIYTKFVSLISSDPVVQTLLPLTPQVDVLAWPLMPLTLHSLDSTAVNSPTMSWPHRCPGSISVRDIAADFLCVRRVCKTVLNSRHPKGGVGSLASAIWMLQLGHLLFFSSLSKTQLVVHWMTDGLCWCDRVRSVTLRDAVWTRLRTSCSR